MTKDLHIFLPDEDHAALEARAKREVRSVSNMALALVLRGLQDDQPVDMAAPKRGRPLKARPGAGDALANTIDQERYR